MKKWVNENKLMLIGIPFGALAGFSYWYFIGCSEGCAITSQWHTSTLYGAVMGALGLSIFDKKTNSKEDGNI